MPSTVKANEDVQLRIVDLLEQICLNVGPLGIQDTANRQRVTIDAFAASLALPVVSSV